MQRTLRRLAQPPVIKISDATFYHQLPPSAESPALFPNLTFNLESNSTPLQHWGVLGGSSRVRTTFLHTLQGKYQCLPPTARSYPFLSTDAVAKKNPRLRAASNAIQYVGFDAERGAGNIRGAYISARYESHRESDDFTLRDFLLGNTQLNASEELSHRPSDALFNSVASDLRLERLLDMSVSNLSNGQTRRSRIAKALLASPEALLLDGPFMGLDISTVEMISALLRRIAESQSPRIMLSLRPDEHLPAWLTHLIFLSDDFKVDMMGPRDNVLDSIRDRYQHITRRKDQRDLTPEEASFTDVARQIYRSSPDEQAKSWTQHDRALYNRQAGRNREAKNGGSGLQRRVLRPTRDGFSHLETSIPEVGEPVVEMNGVRVVYGDTVALGDWKQSHKGEMKEGLWWTVRRGERWGVFGPNGSGKTTLTALISSDHPQTYSLPIKLFGRSRLPVPGQPGLSIFDLQSRIGHSSPEVHAFFPKRLTIRKALESAWAETPLSKVRLSRKIDEKVSAALRWFQAELCPDIGPTKLQSDEMLRYSTFDHLADKQRHDDPDAPLGPSMEELRDAHLEQILDNESVAWADERLFGTLSFSGQRVLLFLRAIIKSPDLIILDEAFSGMDASAKDKCHLFLARGETSVLRYRQKISRVFDGGPKPARSDLDRVGLVNIQGLQEHQALVVIAHRSEEVPGVVRDWLRLPEPGEREPPAFGTLSGPLELDVNGWRRIWGQPLLFSRNSYATMEERANAKRASVRDYMRRRRAQETPEERERRLVAMREYSKRVKARKDELPIPATDSRPKTPK